jgi:hypothetical protein
MYYIHSTAGSTDTCVVQLIDKVTLIWTFWTQVNITCCRTDIQITRIHYIVVFLLIKNKLNIYIFIYIYVVFFLLWKK